MPHWRYKTVLLLIFLFSVFISAISFILQYQFGYDPCPLCIFQRVSVMVAGVISLILFFIPIHKFATKIIAAILILIPTIFGLITAIRQIYIQHLPADQVPTCGPGLNFLFANNSYFAALQKVFMGSGECAHIDKVLFISLPVWGLLSFVIIILLTLWSATRKS